MGEYGSALRGCVRVRGSAGMPSSAAEVASASARVPTTACVSAATAAVLRQCGLRQKHQGGCGQNSD
jgi:hypothetical protein